MKNSSSLSKRSRWLGGLLIIAMLLVIMPQLAAQKSVQVMYTLQEAETGINITNVTIQIKETNLRTNKQLTITEYLASNVANIYLVPGEYEIELVIDDQKTEGKDYYLIDKVIATENMQKNVYLFPVASLRGSVVDRLDNLINEAEIKVECDKDFVHIAAVTTDKFGGFTIPVVPTGNCIIIASHKEFTDRQQLAFNQGDFENINLALDTSPTPALSIIMLTLVGIAMLGGGGWYAWHHLRRYQFTMHRGNPRPNPSPTHTKEQKKEQPEEHPAQPPLPSRVKHILPTLRDRERAVVQFLLDNKGTATQANIKHGTKIPKTSLMRMLDALQTKKIVYIESAAGIKRVKLTDWFMEK